MVALAALLLGLGAPETYARRIMARQARRAGREPSLPPAPTGVTLAEMATHTLLNPLIMLFTEPLVAMITLYLALNFGVLFSWFISVPFVLANVYGFSSYQGGRAFATALAGTAVGALLALAIDQVSTRVVLRSPGRAGSIEHRLVSAMVGACLVVASIFWIGWTASPAVSYYSPIAGNGVYVVGSGMTLVSFFLPCGETRSWRVADRCAG